MLLGVLVAAIWGLNFVAAHLALVHVTPLLLVAVRFAIAGLPALVLRRPQVAWPRMIGLAATLFIGQFVFLFWGMRVGMPAGLASVVLQAQALFTAVLAAGLLRERPTPRKVIGLAIAAAGLGVIAATVGTAGVTTTGLLLTLVAAVSWACGNILLRGVGPVDMLALVAWLSLIPPLPLLAASLAIDGTGAIAEALSGDVGATLAAILYIAFAATIAGYAIWGHLLRVYPAGTVAPFALLVPPFGLAAAHLALGEQFGPQRLAGVALVIAGLLLGTVPLGWRRWPARRQPGAQPSGPS